jgi:hypothetical protein
MQLPGVQRSHIALSLGNRRIRRSRAGGQIDNAKRDDFAIQGSFGSSAIGGEHGRGE